MTFKKADYILMGKFSFVVFISCVLFYSCVEKKSAERKDTDQHYQEVTIEMNIDEKNCLDILLAKDGTINRKGTGIVDTADKDFIIGVTDIMLFDSLTDKIPNDLFNYCNAPSPNCDTGKTHTCKIKIAFAGNDSDCEINYCIPGTADDMPNPIKEFIKKAIRLTDPWYQAKKNILLKRSHTA